MWSGADQERGAVALEFALLLPLVALLLVAALQVVGLARDVVVVQDLARQAVRVAAASGDDAATRAVVEERLPRAAVVISPLHRRVGDLVHVVVRQDASLAGVTVSVTGQAVARVEPGAS